MSINQNIRDLIKNAYFYQYAGIADSEADIKKKKPKLYFTKMQWFFILFALLFNIILRNGFSQEFAGYVISGMSLFVGLFFTFILTIYDKFQNINFSQYRRIVNEEKYCLAVRLKNYFKKTTVLSLYTILLSFVCIVLLSLTLLFETKTTCEIDVIAFVRTIRALPYIYIIKAIGLLLYRTVVMYFLLDFLYIAINLISSFYDFIVSEYNKVRLS